MKIDNFAPIVLFVYNRPWHTEQTVVALKKNELASESDLFIFADGSKVENDENVKKVREYIKTIDGFKSITIIERDKNLGLANSVITGVTEIVNKFGKVIVLEDDIVTSRFFLKFMNKGLDLYSDNELVAGVSGWTFNGIFAEKPFFLRTGSCWGWGTWKRVWKRVNFNAEVYVEMIERANCIKQFNLEGAYDYFSMLKNEKNSWAIKFYASYFLNRQMFLFSPKPLAVNIGFDDTGINCGKTLPKWAKSELYHGNIVLTEYIEPLLNEKILLKVFDIFAENIKNKQRLLFNSFLKVYYKMLKSIYRLYVKILYCIFPLDLIVQIYKQKHKNTVCGIWGSGTVFYEEFNLHNHTNLEERFLVGKNSHLRCQIIMFPSSYGIFIGNNCYLGDGTRIFSSEKIIIGNDVLISHNVNIMDNTTHEMDSNLRASNFIKLLQHGHSLHNEDLGFGEIKINDKVWIGCNSFIGKGITIGEGVVVASNSVVTKDVPPYSLVAGNPAKVIKKLQ